ncbi:MAG: hypothetical protein J1E56_03725 [Ruminococcus sp.]|nr:hypothetical protein [Ruminococcus sp.]
MVTAAVITTNSQGNTVAVSSPAPNAAAVLNSELQLFIIITLYHNI